MEVAERIVAQVASGNDVSTLLVRLDAIGVPAEIFVEILIIADSLGVTEDDAAHLFAAMLVDRLRSSLPDATRVETDEVRQFLSVLGERRWRRARQAIARTLTTCSADTWCEEP